MENVPLLGLALLRESAEDRMKVAKNNILEIDAELVRLFKIDAHSIGTRNHEEDGIPVKFTVPKKVEWDQDKMFEIVKALVDKGVDTNALIKVVRTVPENDFKNMPKDIGDLFKDARTVTPGKVKVEILKGKVNGN